MESPEQSKKLEVSPPEMKILMVNVYGHMTGGADNHSFMLARALEERGHEVAFLATEAPENVVERGRFVPLTVAHGTRDSLPLRQQASVARKAVWNARAADAARALIAEFQPDLLHVHKLYVQLSVAPVVVASAAGIPIVQTLHDYEFMSGSAFDHRGRWLDSDEGTLSYRMLNSALFPIRRYLHRPRVSAWISVSRYVAERHAARGINSTVLPTFVTGIDAEPCPTFEERSGAVFVGRLDAQKGVMDVLSLAKAEPEIPITIAGAGPLAPEVRDFASRLPNLSFVGYVERDRAVELMRCARVALMPSQWQEPGPAAAVEAMVVGTPVVAYRRGGLGEYVADAAAGRVVAPNAKAMREACSGLVGSRQSWGASSAAGRRAAAETHGIDQYVDRIEGVYRQVCANRPTPGACI
jgi:glycosyltransferase involved in cell wall biosynthesis